MRRPWSLLPALVALAATTMPAVAASADPELSLPDQDRPGPEARTTAAAVRQAAHGAKRREDDSALGVTIDTLSPSYLPAHGPVRVHGTVTNNTGDRWTAINLHLFIGDTPITSARGLSEAAELDPAEPVGDRITAPGTFDTVPSLEPRASAQFSIKVSQSDLGVTQPGVYWFGVHALGQSDEPRDSIADGRARTFLPLVPPPQRLDQHRARDPDPSRSPLHPQRPDPGRLVVGQDPGRGRLPALARRLRRRSRLPAGDLAGRPGRARRRS